MAKNIAYIRVSTIGQNTARQLPDLVVDKKFTDKASAKDINRPALFQLLDYIREGDIVHVHSLDRLGRDIRDLRNLVDTITKDKGCTLKFHKEGLIFEPLQGNNPMNDLLLNLLGSVAEFELALINERRQEGQARAKAEGKHCGRPPALTADQIEEVKELHKLGISKAEIARRMDTSRASIYRALSR
ncbi:MAG: DNA invertase Pin-like site-specific DNA recombinase [Desulforhopalus sp.]|jgi:DNA invertase Pin-like site-specific DNA recombinase